MVYTETYIVPSAGGTETILSTEIPSLIYLSSDASPVLVANYTIEYDTLPDIGTTWTVYLQQGFDLNGNTISIFGKTVTTNQQTSNDAWVYNFAVIDVDGAGTAGLVNDISPVSLVSNLGILDGGIILEGTEPLDRLVSGTSAQMIVCNGSGVPAYVTMSGDVTTSNAGVTTIGTGVIVNADINASAAIAVTKLAALTATKLVTTDASGFITTGGSGVIVNADINASAAIALSKLAALTASKVAVTDGSGIITTANQLSALLGGNGIDNSAATGFPIWTAGTNSVGAFTDVRHIDNISFVTANQGTYYVYFPFPCTVTAINVRVTSVVSGTDDGELTIANNAGTVMTGSALTAGVLAVAASSAFGTGYASTLLTNNTFTAGQYMKITSAKTTTGGVVSADITYTRTTLN